ncbi:MAG: OmpA family protein [Bacteroidota bacterium]
MNKILLFITLLATTSSYAQTVITRDDAKGNAKDYFDRADNDYAFGKVEKADSLFRLAAKEKDNFIDAWLLIGQLNLEHLNRYDEAKKAFEKVKLLLPGYVYEIDFQIARSEMKLAEYAGARGHLKAFLQLPKIAAQQKFLAEKMLQDCDFAEEALKHPVDFVPVNLGTAINTTADESMPSLTADGKYLCFTRHFGMGRFQDEDIYMSLRTSAGFAPATGIGEMINTERFIEGAQNFSPSGKYLFFTSSDRPDGVGRADIYMSRKTGDIWESANNMGSPINTPGYETQPCISADGRDLFFSSVRATGKGGSDIWVSHLNDQTGWSIPVNVGSVINTQFDEMRPYIHPDGNTLYFSSNGLPGMGGYDIYVSRKQADGNWGTPVNLGYPINTAGDELGIFVTADGTTAYFASEQKDSYGQMDIYRFNMPANSRPGYTSYIKGNVFDATTRESIYANVQVYDLETGKLYATLSTDKVNGLFLSTLPAGRNYGIEVMKDGYLFYSQNISLIDIKEGTPYEVDIALHKIEKGKKVVLNNLFFEPEQYTLTESSNTELEIITKLLNKNTSLTIEIEGHTDNTGSDDFNKKLSENRAKSVYNALVSKGVAAERLSYKGYASSQPIAPNTSPEGRAKNRRTEFVVTGI